MHQYPLLRSLTIQSQTLSALTVRFIMTRHGRENVGFFWVVIEPMILCVGVMMLWSVLKGGYEHGLHIVAIIFTGYMPLTLQRHLSLSGVHILRYSKSTLIHRNITYIDNLIARLLLEFFSTSAAAAIIYLSLIGMNVLEPAYDLGLVISGWLLMGAIGSGMAVIYAGFTEVFEWFEKFLPAFNYLLLPICGCFFMVHWLPAPVQQLVLYVPLVHAFESIRAGMFGPSVIAYYSFFYAGAFALLVFSVGLLIIRLVRDRV